MVVVIVVVVVVVAAVAFRLVYRLVALLFPIPLLPSLSDPNGRD
jgi:hypothetical protein